MLEKRRPKPWQRAIHLVVLLALLALLVPLATPTQAQSPDPQISIPKPVVDNSVWMTNWKEKYSGVERMERLIFHEVLVQQYRANPNLDPLRAVELLNAMRADYDRYVNQGQNDEYRALRNKDWYIRTALEVVKNHAPEGSGAGFTADLTKIIYERFVDKAWEKLDSANQVMAYDRRHGFFQDTLGREDAILNDTLTMAQGNSQFATAYDMLYGPELNASIANPSAQAVITANPEIKVPQVIKVRIQPDGRVLMSLQELRDLANSEFTKLHETLDGIQSQLSHIDAQQQDILAWMENQTAREQAQAEAAAQAAAYQLTIDGAQSSLYIVSTLVGFIDPAAGKYISTIGASTITVVDSLNKWMETMAGLGGNQLLGAMSTAVMTGNVLGAVLNIVSLFQDAGPTPEQIIIEEIGRLREQVSELRTEMHDRFNRIDASLNQIYSTMTEQFAFVNLNLWRLDRSIQEIQSSLVRVEASLNRMERNTYELLTVQARRPLLENINGSIGYLERTGIRMPYQPDYLNYENVFHTWGTIHAFDALAAGPTNPDYSDANALAEMQVRDLDANVNYLNGWLAAHGIQPFATARLAGFRDWALSSSAYAQIAVEWPEHAKRTNPTRAQQIIAVGDDLEQALQRIASVPTEEGVEGNTALFDAVFDRYDSKAELLDNALQSEEQAMLSEWQQTNARAEPFAIWGGPDQSVSYISPIFSENIRCGSDTPGTLQTIDVRASVHPAFHFADYAKVGALTMCLGGEWVNREYHENPRDDTIWWFTANLQVTLSVRYNGDTIYSRSFTSFNETIQTSDGRVNKNAGTVMRSNWTEGRMLRDAVINAGVDGTPSPAWLEEKINGARDASRAMLRALQASFYNRVLTSMDAGTLRTPVDELGGLQKVATGLIELGLPVAAQHDDLLRALLYGEQRAVDHQLVRLAYIKAASGLSNETLQTNPRTELLASFEERSVALRGLVDGYLADISAGEHSEYYGLIDNVVMEVSISDWFARLETGNRVLLPVVIR